MEWRRRFIAITRRGRERFEARDWRALHRDALERRDRYDTETAAAVDAITELLGPALRERALWSEARGSYSALIAGRGDLEIAETFWNSVTRRIFDTAGVDPTIEFLHVSSAAPSTSALIVSYDKPDSTESLVRSVIRDHRFQATWSDLGGDVELAAARIEGALTEQGLGPTPDRVEMISATFYRGQGAYLVGTMYSDGVVLPLVLALAHERSGLTIRAVLTEERDMSILFSYTRADFIVHALEPAGIVRFLAQLLPYRRSSELYSALGFYKHGKTELYRDLAGYIASSTDRFMTAPGVPGLVMIVFTLPGHESVFKVIRDHFPPQKTVTPDEVRAKYRAVSRHDRAGRLIDAQVFDHLVFAVDRFDPALLDELREDASRSVTVRDDTVTLHRVYVERRVTPLDLFLRDAGPDAVARAVVDYGTAIKNLAATDIFPGDLLMKNFGVTNAGRIVFYDYDEIAEIRECNFRRLPEQDELSETPAFGIGPNDVFPEEFKRFLGVGPELRRVIEDAHSDLFEPGFWQRISARLDAGELIEIRPYRRALELRGAGDG